MMYCQKCGSLMEMLPKLYLHSGKKWYGCKNCSNVIEYNHCSFTGAERGTNPCHLTYEEYLEKVNKK